MLDAESSSCDEVALLLLLGVLVLLVVILVTFAVFVAAAVDVGFVFSPFVDAALTLFLGVEVSLGLDGDEPSTSILLPSLSKDEDAANNAVGCRPRRVFDDTHGLRLTKARVVKRGCRHCCWG